MALYHSWWNAPARRSRSLRESVDVGTRSVFLKPFSIPLIWGIPFKSLECMVDTILVAGRGHTTLTIGLFPLDINFSLFVSAISHQLIWGVDVQYVKKAN